MAEIIPAVDGVFYFIGSTCHPSLFDHLEGRQVIRWHPLGMPGMVDLIAPRTGIGGGTTMGLRWPTLGHYMGFRRFHLHGLDSSFRGGRTHAYDDYRDGLESLAMQGYRTSLNFMRQVADYREMLDMFAAQPPEDRVSIKLFGDGLLQHTYRDAQHHLRQPS